MEFTKTLQITSDYRDRQSPLDWRMVIFSDAVFVDKTHPSTLLVYQLNPLKMSLEEAMKQSRANPNYFSSEAFIFLGEAEEIDRKHKRIQLNTKNSLSYQYLVLLSGPKSEHTCREDDLIIALQALNEALKMKPKIPSSFADNSQHFSSRAIPPSNKQSDTVGQTTYDRIVQPCISHPPGTYKPHCAAIGERFYEVLI